MKKTHTHPTEKHTHTHTHTSRDQIHAFLHISDETIEHDITACGELTSKSDVDSQK